MRMRLVTNLILRDVRGLEGCSTRARILAIFLLKNALDLPYLVGEVTTVGWLIIIKPRLEDNFVARVLFGVGILVDLAFVSHLLKTDPAMLVKALKLRVHRAFALLRAPKDGLTLFILQDAVYHVRLERLLSLAALA